jgi:endoglucanase
VSTERRSARTASTAGTVASVVLFATGLVIGCTRAGAGGGRLPAEPAARAVGSAGVPIGPSGNNLLRNAGFDDGTSLPWMASFTLPGAGSTDVVNGEVCVQIDDVGKNAWDAQLRHRDMVIQKGHTYTVSFKAHASRPTKMRPKVGMAGPPYAEYWSSTIDVSTAPQSYVGRFKKEGADDGTAEFAFHMGGALAAAAAPAPFKICLDDLHLDDPEFTPPAVAAQGKVPDVRVNQVGYLPHFPKHATLQDASRTPLPWELAKADGAVLAKGTTTVFGEDADAGEHLHVADFSSFDTAGRGYVVQVSGKKSYPFDIGADIYRDLKIDALRYFYYTRSGIPIAMPEARGAQWTHAAGHPADRSTPCGKDAGCTYSLDVSGGWYDAGDYGKYVVSGGIAAWTLLSEFERNRFLGTSAADFGDGKLGIPESKNGVPDILDEARYEIEFLLRMQVPAGQAKAGMVHHKVHDVEWSPLGQAPNESTIPRYLKAPSTAATLNVAAVGAQCARVWKDLDPAFSKKCLAAAEAAWAAAKANPAIYAPESDNVGGGPYDDKNVRDEFYWAAAELFITTAKPEYQKAATSAPFYKHFPVSSEGSASSGAVTPMTWQDTAALGSMSLAVVPNSLDKADIGALRAQIVAAADQLSALTARTGYRVPVSGGPGHRYPWGSNSLVLNNAIVLGLAHDFTKRAKYAAGMVDAMDYILGRNPVAKSYVSGYGENPLEHPHHRFWAKELNPKLPSPPPGIVSGGPNSGLQDPYARAAGLKGCAPQKCYVDDIAAFSVNEVAINWNAPLAWVAAYLDEMGRANGEAARSTTGKNTP